MRATYISAGKLIVALVISSITAHPMDVEASENGYRAEGDSLKAVYDEGGGGAPSFDEISGLEEYLAFAALTSPRLRSAYHSWIAQLKRAGYVGVLPDPRLNYGYFVENVETRVGPQEQRLGFRQLFPWFGTLGARKDIALEDANASYQKYRSQKLALFYRVKGAYYDYYYLGRQIQITRDNIQLLSLWEAVARAKYKAGLRQYSDVLKAQVELGTLQDMLETLDARKESIAARLRAEMNLPPDTDIQLPASIAVEETPVRRESTLKQALEHNPDIGSLVHQIERQSAAERLAGKESFPSFTLGVDYIETGDAVNPLLLDSGKDPWLVSVGVNLPIWFGKNKAKRGEARAKLRQAQYALQARSNSIIQVTEQALFRHDDALRKIQLYRDGLVPKAQQSLNAAFTAYEAGESDFLNVLDTQRQLLDFQLRLDLAVTELAGARAELEMLTGIES